MEKRKLSGWEFKQKCQRKEEQLKSNQTSLKRFLLKTQHDEITNESPIIQDIVDSENESKSTDSFNPIKTIQTFERLIGTAATSECFDDISD